MIKFTWQVFNFIGGIMKKITFVLVMTFSLFFLVSCLSQNQIITYETDAVRKTDINGITDIEYFSEMNGVCAEISGFNSDSEKPDITVKFSSTFDKTITFGDSYYVYKLQDGEWINCDKTGNDVWFAIGYTLSTGGVFEKTYSLATHDLSDDCQYKFVTDFLIDKEPLDSEGKVKHYEIGFYFKLDTPIPYSDENIAKIYSFDDAELVYNNSPDPIAPTIRFNKLDGTYMFSYSAFSSHISMGEYNVYTDRLVLNEFSDGNKYVFDRDEKGFVFNKSESSYIPQYSYSAGADPQEPVPDGALFEWDSSLDFISLVYDTATADLDNDGIDEHYSLSAGPTSGLFTFVLTVSEDDNKKSGVFRSEWVNMRFFKKDGKLKISATTQADVVFLWNVEFDGENLNIPELYYEANPVPDTAKVNYGYITEVGENYEYIIVSEGNDGYIHTNDSEFSQKELFKFYTDSQKTVFRIGDKVCIVHTGEFKYENADDDIPTGEPVSVITIVESNKADRKLSALFVLFFCVIHLSAQSTHMCCHGVYKQHRYC